MKTFPQSTHIALWILAGIIITLTAIALTIPASPTHNSATAGAMIEPVPSAPQAPSEVGSTDGIVMLAAIIALIITVPIILRWKDWIRKDK